jgi:hypothetical protein
LAYAEIAEGDSIPFWRASRIISALGTEALAFLAIINSSNRKTETSQAAPHKGDV